LPIVTSPPSKRDELFTFLREMIYGTMDYISSPWAMLQREHSLVNELDGFYALILWAIKTENQK
jgi:hypothetical protein